MPKGDYLQLGRKVAPSFEKADAADAAGGGGGSASCDREAVYELFLRYEEWKAVFKAYDVMDAVFHIHREIASHGYRGEEIHEVYGTCCRKL